MKKFEDIKKFENIILEIGSGNGHFLKTLNEKYKNDISTLVVGVELANKHYKIALAKNKKYDNCMVISGDINKYLKYIKNNSVNEIHINFPDPWYKKKHNKRILCKSTFIYKLSLLLKKNGILSIVTDVFELSKIIMFFAERVKTINNNFKPAGFRTNIPFSYTSFYKKAVENSSNIYFLNYCKT